MNNEIAMIFRQMEEIDGIVRKVADMHDLEATLRRIGRQIGKALLTWNIERGHQPGWLSKKARESYRDLTWVAMEEVNKVLGLPPDYLG